MGISLKVKFNVLAKLRKKMVFNVDPGQSMRWKVPIRVNKYVSYFRDNEENVHLSDIGAYQISFRVYSDAVSQYSEDPAHHKNFGFVQIKDDSFRLRNRQYMVFSGDRANMDEAHLQQLPQGFAKHGTNDFIGNVPEFMVKTEDKLVEG